MGGSRVDIWVTGAPAQFWTFKVYCAETKKTYRVTTGSGGLTDYWDSIQKIANDMLVIKLLEA